MQILKSFRVSIFVIIFTIGSISLSVADNPMYCTVNLPGIFDVTGENKIAKIVDENFLLPLDTVINGGKISGFWPANKTFIIKSDVEVPVGATLQIEAGVTIKLYPGVRITVRGNLIAIGTQSDTIKFIPENSNSYWNNISFKGSGKPLLRYCKFEGTEKSNKMGDNIADLFGAINFSNSSRIDAITDCLFKNNKGGAIYINGSEVTRNMRFENLDITLGDNFGIVFRGGNYDSLTFINNKIEGNINTKLGFTGIRIEKTQTNEIILKDNRVTYGVYKFNEHFGGALIIESPEVSEIKNVSLENDIYEESQGKKAAVYIKARSIKIENTTIKNNFGAEGGGCYLIGDSIAIDDTEFSGNKGLNDENVFYGGGGLAIEIENHKSQITIKNSEFTRNTLNYYNGGGIRIVGNESNLGNLVVQNSTFDENNSNLNGGAVGISKFNQVDNIHLNSNSFNENLAKGGQGGSGIWIDSIKVISSFAIQVSKKIRNHKTEFGNGGFLSINNGVEELRDFKYLGNIHEGYAKANGRGGLIYLNANKIDDIYFNENIGISGVADLAGGIVFCKNKNSINTISLKGNKIVESKAKNEEGGGFAFGFQDFKNFEFTGNNIDTTYAKADGGLLFFSHVSSPMGVIQINDNHVNIGAESGGNGGSYYLNGSGDIKSLGFSKNSINESKASGKGGVLFVNFGGGETIDISDNQITNSVSDNQGGCFYFSYSKDLNLFAVKRNRITNSESSFEGGLIYFSGKLPHKELELEISENDISSTKSKDSRGGLLYLSGSVNQNVVFKNNIIGTSSSFSDGGLVYCYPNTLDTEKITFADNTISVSSLSVNGSGGLLFGEGKIGLIEIIGNKNLNSLSASGSGGGIYWKNSGAISINVEKNTVKESRSVNASGGFMFIEAEGMNSITVKSNSFANFRSLQSGGGFQLNSSGSVEDVMVNSNKVSNSIAEGGDGGFINIDSPALIKEITVDSNQFGEGLFSAALNGGIIALKANSIWNTLLTKNAFEGSIKAQNGGGLYIDADLPLNSPELNLTVSSNTVKANIEVTNNGGFIFYSGKNDQDLIFNNNDFTKLLKVGNAGGMIYMENNNGTSNEIRIFKNSFMPATNNDRISVNTGGVIQYEGQFNNRSFIFQNNELNKSTASTAGAVIRIQNNSKDYNQNIIQLSGNRFANLQAGINGGIFSFDGTLTDSLIFINNKVNSILTDGQESNGGALFLKNGKDLNIIKIANNKATTIASNYGGGAFLKYDGKKIGSALINNNNLTDIKSKQTGAYDFNFDSLISFNSNRNNYLDIKGENGALYYFKGGESSYINSLSVAKDTLNKAHASQNGGGVYFDLPFVKTANFENLQINDANAGKDGGFIAGIEGIEIGSFAITDAIIDGCYAGNNGGVVALSGKIENIYVTKSIFTNEIARNYGGSFYINGKGKTQGNLLVSECRFVNSFDSNKVEITGDGGALFVSAIKQYSISNSVFKVLNVNNNGGAILARNISNFQIKNCILFKNGAKTQKGGALNVENIDSVTSLNNKYNFNSAKSGFGGGLFVKDCNIFVKNDSVSGNVAFRGGGAYIENSGGTIDSSYFAQNHIPKNNDLTSWGGGLFVGWNTGKTIEIKDSRIYDNRAYYGGGVCLDNASTLFIRNIFDYNGTTDEKGEGAAAFFNNSHDTRLYNCIFHANNIVRNPSQVTLPTSGIHMYFKEVGIVATEIVNCAFRANNSYALGISTNSAVPVDSFNKTVIKNSILFYNGYYSDSIPQFKGDNKLYKFDFSCVEDIDRTKFGLSNIIALPSFESDNGYCLRRQSPCINTGDPRVLYNDKEDRNGLRNDMGVFGGPYMFLSCDATIVGPDPNPYGITVTNNLIVDDLLVYPNPTNGKIFIAPGKTFTENISVKLISYSGLVMQVKRSESRFYGGVIEIDLSIFPKGMYLLQISDNEKSVVKKVILM